jgi:pimeloyl-ACP methyl ester carboxylesterase
MSALAEDWLPPMLAAGSDRAAELLPRLKQMVARSTPDTYAAQIEALLNRPDAWSTLATIKVPTLLLSGAADIWSPISQHERMRRVIPHAALAEIEGAGHMAPVERPDAVAHALRGWLETIPAVR